MIDREVQRAASDHHISLAHQMKSACFFSITCLWQNAFIPWRPSSTYDGLTATASRSQLSSPIATSATIIIWFWADLEQFVNVTKKRLIVVWHFWNKRLWSCQGLPQELKFPQQKLLLPNSSIQVPPLQYVNIYEHAKILLPEVLHL